MNKKKVVLYAGVLVALLSLICIGSASVVEHISLDKPVDDSLFYPVLSDYEERVLLFRLTIFENRYYSNYESSGCNRIYDVNRDMVINFQDAGLCWIYITTPELHDVHGDLLYDVNCDGQVNFQDCGLIWVNRD